MVRKNPFACDNRAVLYLVFAVMGCTVGTPGKAKMMQKPSNRSTVCAQDAPSDANGITLVHFNDVYNVEEHEREPVGGAARFKTGVDSLQHLSPLVLFSGDALNPSNSMSLSPGSLCYSSLSLLLFALFLISHLSFLFPLLLLSLSLPVSTVTQGEQMIPVLNAVGVHAAVYGNHDFGEWTVYSRHLTCNKLQTKSEAVVSE